MAFSILYGPKTAPESSGAAAGLINTPSQRCRLPAPLRRDEQPPRPC